jgi:hypothetical protein
LVILLLLTLIVTEAKNTRSLLEAAMSEKWPVKHMGEITNEGNGYLAMDVTIDRTSKVLEVNQHRSLEKFVHQQGLDECKPLSLPMQKALKLERAEKKCTDKKLLHEFRSAVGSLMHYAVVSRPDIAFAAVKLARLQLYCTDEHLQVAKGVVRYLAGTKNYTLRYDCAGDIYDSVICAVDSDWAEGELQEHQRVCVHGGRSSSHVGMHNPALGSSLIM